MPATTAPIRQTQVTVDNATWATLTAPIDCNTLIINNVNTGGTTLVLKIRTDSTDATTEIRVNPGQQYQIGGPFSPPHNYGGRFRFYSGAVAGFAQLISAGSFSVGLVWL